MPASHEDALQVTRIRAGEVTRAVADSIKSLYCQCMVAAALGEEASVRAHSDGACVRVRSDQRLRVRARVALVTIPLVTNV